MHFADHGAPGTFDGHARTYSVFVALHARQLHIEPVIVVGRVQPQAIGEVGVAIHVAITVTRVHVLETIGVEIAEGEAEDLLAGGEQVGHFREGAITISGEEMFGAAGEDVEEAIVVHVLHLGLQEEAGGVLEAAACGDVGEVAGAVVLEQHKRATVRGAEGIEVAIVVDIAEVGCPHLLVVLHAVGGGFITVVAVAIVHEEAVPAAAVVRVVHTLATVADVQIDVAIVVEISGCAAVVAAHVVRGRTGAGRGPRHEVGVVRRRAAGVGDPNVARTHIVACEHVHTTIVVPIGHRHALREDGGTVEVAQCVDTARGDVQEARG